MNTFRKKPVVISAFQMTKARRWDNSDWPVWLHDAWQMDDEPGSLQVDRTRPAAPGRAIPAELLILTLEGAMSVGWGDWIIQGVAGELYPCKDSIFAATYDAVVDSPPAPEAREIEDHLVDGCTGQVRIQCLDQPGQGNACHEYVVHHGPPESGRTQTISFQNGPIGEAGPNGLTNESLLAILIDRLRGFQSGEFACAANESAKAHCWRALRALNIRTKDRVARGVEGKNVE